MAYLARVPAGSAVMAREIARETDIPPDYLSKILASLRNAGLLESTRGTRGGYRLVKPPAQIFLVDIVEPFEALRRPRLCLLGRHRQCSDHEACSAHAVWQNLSAAYMGLLVSTSLAVLVGQAPLQPTPTFGLVQVRGNTDAI